MFSAPSVSQLLGRACRQPLCTAPSAVPLSLPARGRRPPAQQRPRGGSTRRRGAGGGVLPWPGARLPAASPAPLGAPRPAGRSEGERRGGPRGGRAPRARDVPLWRGTGRTGGRSLVQGAPGVYRKCGVTGTWGVRRVTHLSRNLGKRAHRLLARISLAKIMACVTKTGRCDLNGSNAESVSAGLYFTFSSRTVRKN